MREKFIILQYEVEEQVKEELNDLHGVPVRMLGLHCLFLLLHRLFELILQCSLRGYTAL